jgi:hypothetical protein
LFRICSEKRTAQHLEKLRKTSLLNYKSAALPTELCRHFARGNAAFSSNFRPHSIRNFLWDASWHHGARAQSKTKNKNAATTRVPRRELGNGLETDGVLISNRPPNNMPHQLYSL